MRDHGYACFYLFLFCLGVLSVYAYFCVSIRAHLRILDHNVQEGRTTGGNQLRGLGECEFKDVVNGKAMRINRKGVMASSRR